jgi:hypothetical protein
MALRRPSVEWLLLARKSRVRPSPAGLLTGGPAEIAGGVPGLPPLTHQRHWLCTAAMVLVPVSAPYQSTRLSRYNAVP